MKTNQTLIRAQRWKVDELRRRLTELETMRTEMIETTRRLDETVESEKARVQDSELGHFAFPGFALAIRQRQENIAASIRDIERQIEEARENLNEAFRELKKIELVEAERVRKAEDEQARAAQNALDDQASVTHAREMSGD